MELYPYSPKYVHDVGLNLTMGQHYAVILPVPLPFLCYFCQRSIPPSIYAKCFIMLHNASSIKRYAVHILTYCVPQCRLRIAIEAESASRYSGFITLLVHWLPPFVPATVPLPGAEIREHRNSRYERKKDHSHTQTYGKTERNGRLMYSPVNSPDQKSDTRQNKVPN
jgi:hypothetical protein